MSKKNTTKKAANPSGTGATANTPTIAGGGAPALVTPQGTEDVTVDVTNGEFLHYTIVVEGATPNFTLSCNHRPRIKKASQFPGHPKRVYEWDFLNNPGDVDVKPLDGFTLGMLYIAARQYHVLVDHHKPDGAVINIVDRTFANDPGESDFTTLFVLIK